MRGRKPKPTALHLVQGDTRKQGKKKLRARAKREPKPTGKLTCPDHLDEDARAVWEKKVRECPWLTSASAETLEVFCVNVAGMRFAKSQFKNNFYVKGPNFDVEKNPTALMQHPLVSIYKNCATMALKAAAELGFTETARARLAVGDKDNELDEFEQFLKSGSPG